MGEFLKNLFGNEDENGLTVERPLHSGLYAALLKR
jgi:hypothetical protein